MKDKDLNHLINMMDVQDSSLDNVHTKSIMQYGKVCDHDSDFLCKHRRDVIINFIKLKTDKT